MERVLRKISLAWQTDDGFAEELSDGVGLPYTDRHGARRFEEKEGDMMVERVLKRYCEAVDRPYWHRLHPCAP